ncbi:MAG: gamma-glutamyltransferase [Acidobacteria bacterium]|nr:gamma-glutamyltransferase [Acidobacteriota bacterium]
MALLLLASVAFAQDRHAARSMVVSQYGIVAASYVQASQAGAEILRKGGSAVDAAIAANAVLGVEEPMMNGIGGDLFAIYWDGKSGKLYGLNASGWAPEGLTPEHLKAKALKRIPLRSIDSVTVPGAVAGWKALHDRFGKLPLTDVLAPAIYYAGQGFPVPELDHEYWSDAPRIFSSDPEGQKTYLPGGQAPALGEIFRNPNLRKALSLIAQQGADAYYKGEIAHAILGTSQAHGGTMSAADLADFRPEWVEPVSTTYRGWTVYELPPNGQGMAALEMLNIMETSPRSPLGPLATPELHKKIEAMKLAYADLEHYNADPRFAKVPVKALLSKGYAMTRARLIDWNHANCDVAYGAPENETTYIAAVDREGNIASLIQSNYETFGSGITVESMGFVLQDRGALFSLDPDSPNLVAPHKRPFHTIIPAFMERGDEHIGFGIMGGANQPLAHAQFVSNIADYGMNIQQALESARFTVHPDRGCNIRIESRVKPDVLDQLSSMGHKLKVAEEYSSYMGRGNAVMHDAKAKINYGGSDARADGSAEPEPPPSWR